MSLHAEDSAFKPKALTIFSGNTTEFQEFKDDFQDIANSMQILHLITTDSDAIKPLSCPEMPEKATQGIIEIYRQDTIAFKKQEKSIRDLRQMLIEGLDIHVKNNLFPNRAVLRTKNVFEIIHALIQKYGIETAADIKGRS